MQSIKFEASIATTQQAIQRHGEGGYRLVLDVPECYSTAIKRLMDWIQATLKVTVEVGGGGSTPAVGGEQDSVRAGAEGGTGA